MLGALMACRGHRSAQACSSAWLLPYELGKQYAQDFTCGRYLQSVLGKSALQPIPLPAAGCLLCSVALSPCLSQKGNLPCACCRAGSSALPSHSSSSAAALAANVSLSCVHELPPKDMLAFPSCHNDEVCSLRTLLVCIIITMYDACQNLPSLSGRPLQQVPVCPACRPHDLHPCN